VARFVKGRSGNPQGRRSAGSAPAAIAATFRDLAVASLLYRGERCRDSAVAHRCIAEARKCIAALRTQRAAAVAALPPPPEPTTKERVHAALAAMDQQQS
jgi:hypothetical protein